MRLSVSISLWLTAAVLILLGGHGWLQLEEEARDLEAAARRELSLVATAITIGVENAIRDHQEPDVAALLERFDATDPAVDVFVLDSDGAVLGSSFGADDNLATARSLASTLEPRGALWVESLSSGELAAIGPLRIAGVSEGSLVVIRSMHALEADLSDERRAVVRAVGLLTIALLAIIWVVVRVRVHLPLGKIIARTRRIQAGDLAARIGLTGSDEFSELGHEFDAMTASLEQARRDLASAAEARGKLELEMQRANKLAVVGEIAATLAHEIGSPLQVLHGRARDLALRADLPHDVTRSAAILVTQTERLHQIVERLLDVARRKAPLLAELDPRALIEQVVELIGTYARREGVRLEVTYGVVPRVHADLAQLQQVVLNLLQNALRAAGRGGSVRITVGESSFTRVDGRSLQSIELVVEDSGPGIAPEILDHIFEPFVTAWAGERSPKGTGLGLAVVKSIVQAHAGTVSAVNLPHGGARFVVHIPVHGPEHNA